MSQFESIALIGNGRVAHQLGAALNDQGVNIEGVYGRNSAGAEKLAEKLDSRIIDNLSDLIQADLILLTVSDDAVSEVASQLNPRNKGLVAHTSGAVPLSALEGVKRKAVFYPLQSFSLDKNIVWENVPFCLEAENDEDLNGLGELAELLSQRIHVLSSDQRKSLHLAAVFANNFANLMFELSEDLLAKAEIDRSILHPLILETANKVLMQSAKVSQTGPAARGDKQTIKMHRALLGEGNSYRNIYDRLTNEIYNRTHEQEL
ncbi:DUF2520 domain-containing protein [Cryomorphaceae bacterium 1068]|nr:DUF2520 domain-containing protein [Cryomorphaceae bacterium 1068]